MSAFIIFFLILKIKRLDTPNLFYKLKVTNQGSYTSDVWLLYISLLLFTTIGFKKIIYANGNIRSVSCADLEGGGGPEPPWKMKKSKFT